MLVCRELKSWPQGAHLGCTSELAVTPYDYDIHAILTADSHPSPPYILDPVSPATLSGTRTALT